jgi:Na+/H+-dicarboxylate symporter
LKAGPEEAPHFEIRLSDNPRVVLGSILAGLAVGHLAPESSKALGVVGDIYVDLLKMVVLPFMMAAVIFSLRKLLTDEDGLGILPRIGLAFVAAFGLAALAGLLIGLLMGPGRHLPAASLLAMGRLAGTTTVGGTHDTLALFGTEVAARSHGLGALALSLIPANIFDALTQGETLKVMAFSLLFGLVAGRIHGRMAETLTDVMETVYEACLTLTQWFNLPLPLVLFAVVAHQTARAGLEPLGAMLKFLVALGLGAGLLLLLALWGLRMASGRAWKEVLESQREPLLMASITRSPYACMPKMIESLVDSLGFARSRIELLVPLGISLVRPGAVLYLAMTAIFVAQLYHVHLGAPQLGVVAAGSILTGLAASGMNSIVITTTMIGLVCNLARLPFEAVLAGLMAVDPLIDVLIAVMEVACSNGFAAAVAGRQARRRDPGDAPDGILLPGQRVQP